MEKISCWEFKKHSDIDKVISMIEEDRKRYKDRVVFLIGENQESYKKQVKILDKDIEYSFIKIKTEDSYSKEHYTNILLYKIDEGCVKLNVFRGSKNTLNIIKPYFYDSKWEGIRENKLNISDDLLFWLFKSYLEFKSESLSKSDLIYINALKGYSGETKDKGNRIRGEGERISDILGTLAFLLNNDPLKMIRPKIFYKYGKEMHDILLEIKMTGTTRIDVKNYKGSFNGKYEGDELVAILSILCSEFILPKLILSYKEAKDNDEWNISIKRDFLRRIGIEIQDRVTFELEKLGESDIEEDDDIEDDDIEDDDE